MQDPRPRLGMRRRTLALLGALVLAGIAGGVAWAAIPSDGVIHGCYRKSDGALRVIDPSVAKCKRTERAIQWNSSERPNAAYSEWNGSGGTNYVRLVQGRDTVIHDMEVPANLAGADDEVVAITTVWITNWGTSVNGGCGVWATGGSAYAWPFTLQHGFDVITIQGRVSLGEGRLEVRCTLDGAPTAQVWAEVAALTVLPDVAIVP